MITAEHRHPGRPKGAVNKTTKTLREAILAAAEGVGFDGNGKDGMIGYLRKLASTQPKAFAGLLGRVVPLQISSDPDNPIKHEHVISFKG